MGIYLLFIFYTNTQFLLINVVLVSIFLQKYMDPKYKQVISLKFEIKYHPPAACLILVS